MGYGRLVGIGILFVVACSGKKPGPIKNGEPRRDTTASRQAQPEHGPYDASPGDPELGALITHVSDPAALVEVAQAGASLATLLSGDDIKALKTAILSDWRTAKSSDRRLGVTISKYPHRLFDSRWLDDGAWELVGIFPRLDLKDNTPGECGDVRLLYRLSYAVSHNGEDLYSRLPATMAVVLRGDKQDVGGGCSEAARKWRTKAASGSALAKALLAGPLHNKLDRDSVTQVLTDMQIIRWPSSMKPDLGGHAEYVLRRFGGKPLKVEPVDNTPKISSLVGNNTLKKELQEWIAANIDAIDRGTFSIPKKFLATKASSFTPRGMSRLGNRPFSQLFSEADFAGIDFDKYSTVRSPAGLLRRLDQSTCGGCHQSRTVAGFHWLGIDPDKTPAGNALAVAHSPSLWDELNWRGRLMNALSSGGKEQQTRPFKDRGPNDGKRAGDRCTLTDDPSFSSWSCAPPLKCQALDNPGFDQVIGTCLRDQPEVGDSCEFGSIRARKKASLDRARNVKKSCVDSVCNTNRVGFPAGMCTAGCDDSDPRTSCGVIALLGPFNNCLARSRPFTECVTKHVSPAGLRACDDTHPCREDYICAETPSGDGGCIPPYFLFQLRVDGHPTRQSE